MLQQSGLKRDTVDKFYTSKNAVDTCINLIKENIDFSKNDLCIEPSAGNGAFLPQITTLSDNCKFYDIEPENKQVVKQDYLELDTNLLNLQQYNKIHVIGNPPFGRQSSMAIKFIKKSTQYADTISFILPKSFKKDSLQKKFPLNFHLICEHDIPEYSFIINDKKYNVPCVFQIWTKQNVPRKTPEILLPKNYSFTTKLNSPDISFRRVGVNSGDIENNPSVIQTKSDQSHYFIKFKEKISNEFYQQLKLIEYPTKNNTVGPKSISKQELIKEFNKLTT